MKSDILPLLERRERLVALAASQRRALAADVQVWSRPLSFVDRAAAALRFVANHPLWIIGSALAPPALRGGGFGAWVRRGAVAVRIARGLRRTKLREPQ